jgi:hypothetical protein
MEAFKETVEDEQMVAEEIDKLRGSCAARESAALWRRSTSPSVCRSFGATVWSIAGCATRSL